MDPIKEFKGEYRWLSNFWLVKIEFEGETYPSVEHAYQALKFNDVALKKQITQAETPGQAKKIARQHEREMRKDWFYKRTYYMTELVMQKFKDPELRKLLLSTGDALLQEGNSWGDRFWGVDLKTKKGQNVLGEILMRLRSSIRRGEHPIKKRG